MLHFKGLLTVQGVILSALLAICRGDLQSKEDDQNQLDHNFFKRTVTEPSVVDSGDSPAIPESIEHVTHQTYTESIDEVVTKETNFKVDLNLEGADPPKDFDDGGLLIDETDIERTILEGVLRDGDKDTKDDTNKKRKMLGAHVLRMEGDKVYEEDEELFHPIQLPTEFSSYDVLEQDGFITLAELVNVTGAQENVELAFNASDKNGDGKLTPDEFLHAPWSLATDESSYAADTASKTVDGAAERTVDDDDERSLDPEIKRYLLTPEELEELEARRKNN